MTLNASRNEHRRPSLADVAEAAGVSKGAVSKVIRNAYGVSPSMRARVEAKISELGYRPRTAARAMRGSSFTIGFEIPNLGNEFFTRVLDGAAMRLSHTNYQLIIAPGISESSAESVLNNLVDRQVDGLIAISPEVVPERLERIALQVPTVMLGRHDRAVNYDSVVNDDEAGVTLMLDHLRGLGHTRIAHLTLDMKINEENAKPPHSLRRETYERIQRNYGAEPIVFFSDVTEDSARKSTHTLLDNSSVTAIFAGNDTLALGAMRAIAERGLDAQTIAVAGYDDIRLASHPLVSLTTVSQFGEEMGRVAVDMLMDRIASGRRDARVVEIQPELMVRSSTFRSTAAKV